MCVATDSEIAAGFHSCFDHISAFYPKIKTKGYRERGQVSGKGSYIGWVWWYQQTGCQIRQLE